MEEKSVGTWEEFLRELEEIQKLRTSSAEYVQNSPLLFRGQSNSCWSLSATLERACPRMLYTKYYRMIDRIRPQIESLTGDDWPIPPCAEVEELARTYQEFDMSLWTGNSPAYAYMVHLRHHGFPSPLLDWTRSLYIAAYFAFANARTETDGSVSIFVLSERNFRLSGNQMNVVHICRPHVKTHRRHVFQQSQYTICMSFQDEWRFESYDSVFDKGHRQQACCWKFRIPVTERRKVLALLDEYNLNAFSLFGSEESLMDTLATREFG